MDFITAANLLLHQTTRCVRQIHTHTQQNRPKISKLQKNTQYDEEIGQYKEAKRTLNKNPFQ